VFAISIESGVKVTAREDWKIVQESSGVRKYVRYLMSK
jgi:hypothetical protein